MNGAAERHTNNLTGFIYEYFIPHRSKQPTDNMA